MRERSFEHTFYVESCFSAYTLGGRCFYMKYDLCHASKDFLREAGILIDSLIYSETRAMENAEQSSLFHCFCAMMIPLMKTGEEMTESLLFLSSYEPLIAIAEFAEKELFSERKSLEEAKKNYNSLCSENEKEVFTQKAKNILERLGDDLVSFDISERLCCDYLRYMICILEGAVRLCESASENEKCDEILAFEKRGEMRYRELMNSMKSLLSLIK